jgi:hypothetical protein
VVRDDIALKAIKYDHEPRSLRMAASGMCFLGWAPAASPISGTHVHALAQQEHHEPRTDPDRRQSGYSSFRHVRGSAGWVFGVRSSRKLKYGATNGSGAITVYVW